MDITVKKEDLRDADTGGGYRNVDAVGTIDENLSPRLQRKVTLFEPLCCLLEYLLTEPHIDDIAEILNDTLAQLEPIDKREISKARFDYPDEWHRNTYTIFPEHYDWMSGTWQRDD